MNDRNPYAAPTVELADVVPRFDVAQDAQARHLKELAGGQRMMLWSIVVGFVVTALSGVVAMLLSNNLRSLAVLLVPLLMLVVMAVAGVAMIGAIRVAHSLWNSVALDLIIAFVCWIPLLNLVLMLILSASASSRLKAGGYTVGLLGARLSRT